MRINKTSVVVLSVLVLTATQTTGTLPVSSSSNPQTAEAKAQETVDLKVSGMTWPVNCPKRVRSALEKIPGVISAEVTHPDKAVVKVEKGKADAKKLIAAIEKAGYKASLREKAK